MVESLTAEEWHELKLTFMNNGFSKVEAEWAATENLDPNGPRALEIRRLLRNRRIKVRALMASTGFSRRDIILALETSSRATAKSKGFDEWNLFAGAT